jgi:hypothetical protein
MDAKNLFSKLNPFLKHQALQKLMGKCPLCNFEYKTVSAKIIQENEEAQLIYIKCPHCSGSLIVVILSSGPLISSIGLVTDLNEEDLSKIKKNKTIFEEDILNLHQIIKEKNFCLHLKNNFNK